MEKNEGERVLHAKDDSEETRKKEERWRESQR